jgi:hypothetical protein
MICAVGLDRSFFFFIYTSCYSTVELSLKCNNLSIVVKSGVGLSLVIFITIYRSSLVSIYL